MQGNRCCGRSDFLLFHHKHDIAGDAATGDCDGITGNLVTGVRSAADGDSHGVTVVIVREDLLGNAMDFTPTMLRYDIHADNNSLYNTPPTYGIYFMGLVFQWVKKQGGVAALQKINEHKAGILYDFLDQSELFKGTVAKKDRSLMNATFVLPTKELDEKFIKEAKALGFENLKGQRTVGGMRASMYNAMPVEGVEKLVEFMKKFEMENK